MEIREEFDQEPLFNSKSVTNSASDQIHNKHKPAKFGSLKISLDQFFW